MSHKHIFANKDHAMRLGISKQIILQRNQVIPAGWIQLLNAAMIKSIYTNYIMLKTKIIST